MAWHGGCGARPGIHGPDAASSVCKWTHGLGSMGPTWPRVFASGHAAWDLWARRGLVCLQVGTRLGIYGPTWPHVFASGHTAWDLWA